jgi:hypothetical protein
MSGQTDLDLADAEPGASHDALFEEYNFEQLFGIPPDHRLMLVRSRSRGGFARAVYWQHDEYDPAGAADRPLRELPRGAAGPQRRPLAQAGPVRRGPGGADLHGVTAASPRGCARGDANACAGCVSGPCRPPADARP